MAGQAHTPGMGLALAIAQHQVRRALEFSEGPGEHRQFPKREQPRYIGKIRLGGCNAGFQNFKLGKAEHRDGGAQSPAAVNRTHVGAGNPRNDTDIVFEAQPPA